MESLQILLKMLATGQTTSELLVSAALARIADPAGEGASAFRRVYHAPAIAEAKRADARRKRGTTGGALAGVPISVKDLFDVAGEPTLAGSVALRDAPNARNDAEAVARLRAAGAIIVGKTNMTEFAYSGLGINPHYGTPRAPWDRKVGRIPGGSTSGGAVSVSDGMAAATLGSDTGGSLRIPAAFCGLVGFKPTASRVPLAGALPLSPTLDSVGAMAPTVACCALLDAILSGEPPVVLAKRPVRDLRFAMPRRYVLDHMDDQVAGAFERTLSRLAANGVEVVEVDCFELDDLREINANGGFPAYESYQWHAALIERRQKDYDPRVLKRIVRGKDLTRRDMETLKTRRIEFQRQLARSMNGYHALLMPTVPILPPRIADLSSSDEEYYRANALVLRNPSIANFFDGCSISLPCNLPGEAPVGLMLIGKHGKDHALLEMAQAIEDALCEKSP